MLQALSLLLLPQTPLLGFTEKPQQCAIRPSGFHSDFSLLILYLVNSLYMAQLEAMPVREIHGGLRFVAGAANLPISPTSDER